MFAPYVWECSCVGKAQAAYGKYNRLEDTHLEPSRKTGCKRRIKKLMNEIKRRYVSKVEVSTHGAVGLDDES
jgi:hypothetical protein